MKVMVDELFARGDGVFDASRIMNVSPRTLRSWRAGDRRPSAAHMARLRGIYQRLVEEDTSVWELRHNGPWADAE